MSTIFLTSFWKKFLKYSTTLFKSLEQPQPIGPFISHHTITWAFSTFPRNFLSLYLHKPETPLTTVACLTTVIVSSEHHNFLALFHLTLSTSPSLKLSFSYVHETLNSPSSKFSLFWWSQGLLVQ